MPCRNGPIAYKRKHGVCFPKFGLLSSFLLALCCLQALSGDGRPCSPCPGNCSCAAVGPQNFCVVNCSNVGLDQAPAAAELPTDTHSLDLSRNLIPGLDFSLFHHLSSLKELFLQNNRLLTLPHGVFHCGPLTVLDLSNNQITTIEERICENLFNLTTIDLSSNPFVCDCKLVRLVSWLQERGVAVKRPDSMLCDRPPEVKNQPLLNVSVPTCGLTYAGCLQDQEHAAGVELVIFSSSTPGPYSREECNSKCFHENQLYGGLGEQSECLCSTNSEPNHISESQCSAACSNPRVMKECHWTVAQDVFQVNFSASLPSQRVSVFSEALLSVSSSVLPVSLSWDFGDLSPRVNFSTPNTTARHKYALPGRYQTQVVLSAGHHEITAQGNVSVELPPRLELHCPEQIVADRSLEEAVSLVNWGGVDVSVDWRISKDGMEIIRAEPPCPPDALHQADSSRCFLLVSEEVSWSDARRNCSARGGELAVVHSQSVRDLLAPHITQERGVWLGLTDKYSPRVLSWVDGSGVRPGEEGLRDRGRTEPGNMCVSLDHSAQPSTHSCTAKRAFVCQFTSHVRVPDAGVYTVGTAVFNTHTHLMSPTTVYTVPNTPAKSVELMLFPALMFLNAGRLSAVELVTRSLTVETQLRLQLYRPQCQGSARPLLPGCGDLCAPFAVCPDPDEPLNTTCSPTAPVWCPVGQQLCPHIQRCLPLSSSCQPDARENCSWLGTLPAGSRVPEYSLTAEVLVTLPAGPPAHVLVQEELEDLLVASGDFIALQHDAGPSGLLQCSSNPSSPWKQFVLVHNRSDWWDVNETVKVFGDGGWEEGLECQVRALYVGQNSTRLQGPSLSRGLALPGNYSLEVTSNDKDFPVIASCPIRVIPPLGPKIIFPATHNGAVYFLPNQTWVLIKICSQHSALIVRLGSNTTVHFSNSCPSNLVANVSECRHSEAKDNAMFAWVNLQLGDVVGQTTVVLLAQNGVTDSELQIQARVQEPLRGLVVQPHPVHRVLNETVVRYTASVEGGTDPSFRWTVDDKPYFTYYNSVLNIIYKNAAVYKLTVTAMNQVSMLTEHFDVTVDQMKPMSDFSVHGVPDIVRQGFPLNLSVTVKIDAAVNVSFWWLFGDGGNRTRQFTTPYENSSFNQVVIRDDVEYIYTQPGEYTLTFSATNRYESKTCKINVHVFSILTHVQIETDPRLLRAGKVAEFEAHPLPSPYGIIYTWNFGDNSSLQQGRERRVPHAYAHSGIYNICVNVNNTISWTDTCADVMVYEDIEGLMVTASPLTERNTPTVISANLGAGNNVTWSFDMGDGSQLTSAEPRVEYTYRKDGNYTVNITAQNPVSLQWTTIQVEVFVLQILALEPAGCIQENQEVLFQAFVLGNASGHQYVWSFGDGSPNETHYGAPVISHAYNNSGEYHLSLLMSSEANKANFYTRICVQPEIKAVSLLALRSHVQPGEKCKLKVEAFPEFNYTYMWDFGLPDSQSVIQGGKDIDFVYASPGQYLVTVTVFNNISSNYTSVLIEVHQPIGFLQISHDGNKGNNLALGQDYTFNAISGTAKAVYSWDFGDGSQTTGENVSHAYNSSGRFNIILVGKNKVSETRNETLVSVLATIKGLSVNASIVNVPLNASVHFEALLESGDDVHFSWSVLSNTGVCDRCKFLPGTHTMFYTFRSVGTFNVIVTAENDIGTNQASISVFVQRELEGLRIVADDLDEGCCFATNRVLPMQASLKEGTNMTFSWKIVKEHENHDLNLTGKNIELNFSNPGLCDVRLKASNLLGQLTVNRTIKFLEPVRELTLKTTPNPAAVNGVTDLTVHAAFGSDLHYRWWFDDDLLLENSPSVEYSFKNPGLKLIKVEVFNKVSSGIVSKLVTVQEPISGLTFTATNVTDQNFVASGINVSLFGETLMGSHISWMWLLPDGTKSNKRVASFVFPKPGFFTVALNATNDISQVGLVHEFTVQDRIQGLELKASKQIAAVREHVEFTISVSAGTSVNFILSISGDATVVLTNQTYVHQFTSVAKYYVNLTAYNQVSSERKTLHIEVMEPVTKLKILDCCDSAIPVGVTKSYVAYTPTRDPLSILWTFDLHHGPKVSLVGKSVVYTPAEPGDLTIYLSAFNSLNGLNVTKMVQVQNIFKSAVLFAEPIDTFINKIVTFKVGITPVSTPATCLWDFGDGTSGAVTNSLTLSHIYHSPGYYVVRVNVSNLVSWVTAQTAVNISVLKCDEPEVQIIQAPRLSIWRYQQTSVEANVNLKGCNLYKVHYLWEILKSAHCQHDENSEPPPSKVLLPGDVRKPRLSVPKMAISAGNYTLVFSLSYEGVPLRKAACVQLSVMSNKLVPIIEGGTYRVWSKTQDLHLSGEPSYDPNLDPENQSLLSYHWECVTTSKGPAHCPTLNFGLNPSGPFLGISGSELEVDVEYSFRLTVSKDGMSPESTTQTVLVQNGRIPIVSLQCVSCKAQSRYEISHNSHVSMAGTCNNCHSSYRGQWKVMSLKNQTLVLDQNTTTTGSEGMKLVLRQGVLQNGESYIFSLHVTEDEMDHEGVAYIELRPNMPPDGGTCSLWADGKGSQVRTLKDKVHFNCSGYTDFDEMESPLVYSLLVVRCLGSYCEEFCIYKGTSPEHSAFLPPGFSSAQHKVSVSVTVEDHQGATIKPINQSMEVMLPPTPDGFISLPHYLSHLTNSSLREMLRQGDSQRVRELSLALITVLNEYEQGVSRRKEGVSKAERQYRVNIRGNITRALTSLDLTTVSDIQQTSAALAQCTAVSREYVCEECQNSTLDKLETMLEILQVDTRQGIVTPTEIADNILNIMGDLIHQVSQAASSPPPEAEDRDGDSQTLPPFLEEQQHHHHRPLRVAAKAYTLSSVLMRILMLARVLNEEPLILRGAEIAAVGKRADPQSLLCYGPSDAPECQRFSIPPEFNSSLKLQGANSEDGIVQLLFQVEPNPFPFNYVANYTISTEVASMEFRTVNGTQIPISDLDESQAITVRVNNGSMAGLHSEGMKPILPPAGAENISRCGSIIVRVSIKNANRQAGIYIQLNFTVPGEAQMEWESNPAITVYLHHTAWPDEHNNTDRKHISLNMTRGQDLDHKRYTFFLSPNSYDTTRDHFLNVSTGCATTYPDRIRLEVSVFTSLCQYFSESAQQWQTDGIVPLAETSAGRAVCSTRHLTAFAASLFVPLDSVSFIIPERSVSRSLVAVLVCVVGLLCYAVAGAILRKLDQMDLRRASVVPLCGKDGLYKYEIQVKTGWGYGAGTTAHVGISLHGSEGRSGHRHLDCVGAFARNSLDIFHIATDASLGSVLKIRAWHDNKGLSPAWCLQYVLVKDLQTGSSFFFLVEEWLSVDNEKTDGRLEIEVEASEEAELWHWPRLLSWELQRAMCESHVWVSLWERPLRSPFTRLQRVTCCALLLHLNMLANAVWYGAVSYTGSRTRVADLVSVNVETVWAGLVSCLLVYPIYLLVFCLFRLSRSKVLVEQLPPQVDQDSLEIDDFLDNSLTGSSLLMLSGVPAETYSEETNIDLPTPSTKSLQRWSVPDCDWPDVSTDPSVEMGPVFPPRLKRGQGSRHLGVDITFSPDEDGTLCDGSHRNKYFSSSDEDLIKRILADGQLLSQTESDMGDLSSIFGDKTEVILLQKMNETFPIRREPPKTAFSSRTVVMDVCKPRRFPPLCGLAALWGSWAGLVVSSSLSMWLGRSFSEDVALMWLISSIISFLSSFLVLEPLKALLEALYFALLVRRLRPEEQDVLVDCPRVERVIQRIPRVRPPQGFALSQAREEARKVRLLHTMLKGFLLYTMFLLVVLLLNYSDSSKDGHRLRFQDQLKNHFLPQHHNISRHEGVWPWLSGSVVPRLLDPRVLMEQTGSVLIAPPRLRQVRPSENLSLWLGPALVQWEEPLQNWSLSSEQRGSTGFIQDLGRNMQESRSMINQLEAQHWLNPLSRTLFLEFSLYNINTDLLAVFSFLLDFPVSERPHISLDLKTCSLHTLGRGLDLPLFLTLILLAFVLYFALREGVAAWKQGRGYFLRLWNLVSVLSLFLAISVVILQLRGVVLSTHHWGAFQRNPNAFSDFLPLARQRRVLTQLSASLLLLLVLKASHQLRFMREWGVFGRALRRSFRELLTLAAALLLFLLAYSHGGHLLFYSVMDGYESVSSICWKLLGSGGRGLLLWRSDSGSSQYSVYCFIFHISFTLLRLVLLWLLISALLRNYRRARVELYRPVVDLQDYEMVELFLRRLKMWMGLSRAKEFRHKVRFEGMELPPSQASSTSDCKSLCVPPLDTPDAPPSPNSVDGESEVSWGPTSSSPCSLAEAPSLGLGLTSGSGVIVGGRTWKEKAETEATLRRILPAFDNLLQQLDRVTQATEELYQAECRLEKMVRKSGGRDTAVHRNLNSAGQRRHKRGQKVVDKCPELAESPSRSEIRTPKSEFHKKERRSKKLERFLQITSGIPTKPQKKESSPEKTNCSLQNIPEKLASLKAESGLNEESLKLEGTLKASPTEKTKDPHRDLSPAKTKGSPSKVGPTIQSNPQMVSCANKPISRTEPSPIQTPAPSTAPVSAVTTPIPIPRSHDWVPPTDNLPSTVFRHPAHTTTNPSRKRKHKPPPLKNKVHPNTDRPFSGHPKP